MGRGIRAADNQQLCLSQLPGQKAPRTPGASAPMEGSSHPRASSLSLGLGVRLRQDTFVGQQMIGLAMEVAHPTEPSLAGLGDA